MDDMPISFGLLLGIPIGLIFYFEARWAIRYALGRYEQRERRAARICGAFGVSLVPLIYCFGLIEDAFPGKLGQIAAGVFIWVIGAGFAGLVFGTLNKVEGGSRRHWLP
ncbi:MAG TPA: hypothetical protein VMA34_14540 [Terracidiphilus sp.]|nr:hypothetical protein [Terracidiphilus sp.]